MDITAHVDFTALQKAGTAAGLSTLGFTSQSIFLSSLGLGEMLTKLSAAPIPQNPNELLSQRRALMNLINPQGLGNNKVLLQAKNVPLEPPLTGFSL
jgi:SAM-dependent MidA family methyltransferase